MDLSKFDRKKLFKLRLGQVLGIGAGLFAILVIALLFPASGKKQSVPEEVVKKAIKIESVTTEDLWRDSIENNIKKRSIDIDSKLAEIKEDLTRIENQKPEEVVAEALSDRVNNLSREFSELKNKEVVKIQDSSRVKNSNIHQFTLNLENSQNSADYKPIKTADNYIPAGSFAKAVLLSGVDASTSLTASGDPDPVLIRIIDHGTLPRRFKSDLKDCHLIGAAFGDLSSERAKVRLEKLSCMEVATAEIVETEVAGYVTGEDGRSGIRGEVVSTEGKLLGNSLAAGVLSGLANNFNPSTSYQPTSIVAGTSKQPGTGERLKDSFASGTTSSLDRLSKYYIDRAESLQPIIQVGAGRKVDVIFTEGVFFGTSEVKKAIAKKRDEKIRSESSNTSLIQPIN